jgi:hypothetical protein
MDVPATHRLQHAWHRRADTDYRFDFWTALGWTLLTFGIFSYYVEYQLCRRMKEHNIRRLQLLEAANERAWQRANDTGWATELTPAFQRVSAHLDVLRRMTTDFRDPALWLVIILLSSGIGMIVLHVLLDQDLVKHGAAEAAAEDELAAIARSLGASVPALPRPESKGQHNYAGRIVALFATCGLYGYWWLYDLMVEGNRHFERDGAWEDAFLPAI